MKFIDLTGKKFGRLTVLRASGNRGIQPVFTCQCECGTICEVRGDKLRSGKTQSCGCIQREYRENENDQRSKKYQIGEGSYTKNEILKMTHMSVSTFYRKLKDNTLEEEICKYTGGLKKWVHE